MTFIIGLVIGFVAGAVVTKLVLRNNPKIDAAINADINKVK
jgi:uncharacterized membrane-anchored protein YhcB (DUF1043 family)